MRDLAGTATVEGAAFRVKGFKLTVEFRVQGFGRPQIPEP